MLTHPSRAYRRSKTYVPERQILSFESPCSTPLQKRTGSVNPRLQNQYMQSTSEEPFFWGKGRRCIYPHVLDCVFFLGGGGEDFFQGEIIYAPPPPPPFFGPEAFFRGGGGGCIFRGPTRQEFYTPPPFYTPPTPRRVFSGVGGWGCIKIWPRISLSSCLCMCFHGPSFALAARVS